VGLLLSRIHGEAQALSAAASASRSTPSRASTCSGPNRARHAFANLASNAVRYTPPGGEVRLIWRASQKGAEFTVEDTGVGIEAEHIPRLTERFYRVDRGRSRETGGTGLGLAIVKHAWRGTRRLSRSRARRERAAASTAKFPARRVVPARVAH